MQLIFKDFETYLSVTCEGLWDPIDVTRAIQEVKVQAERRQLFRVFVDWGAVSDPSTDCSYKALAGEDVARLLPPPFRVAVYDRRARINKVAEGTARGQGAHIMVHHDPLLLKDWLLAA